VRILDLTAFWSGPYATHLLATLGADVIKVERRSRPDGMRFATVASPDDEHWLEFSPTFHAANPAKRSVTIDFTVPSGRRLVLELAKGADVVVENFTPRVLDGVGLGYETLRAVNPAVIMLRIPGFGLDGPWANRSGFAQTMEQISGIGWLTGLADGDPLVRSTMDPISGIHGAIAVLAALSHRDATGEGQLIEMPMVEWLPSPWLPGRPKACVCNGTATGAPGRRLRACTAARGRRIGWRWRRSPTTSGRPW
jgi:crotonobetainyl-CoA:carnitine CoA-transferase CaiB-like acyl-CoA transferase